MSKQEPHIDCTYEVRKDEGTGRRYWYGYCEGDKDGDAFHQGQPLVLKPTSFPVGYTVKGYTPVSLEDAP